MGSSDVKGGHDKSSIKLAIGALGVVFGDIGTSPLYALKECFHPAHGILPSAENILGILSLVFWSLTLVISVKYVLFIMRADNKGEGGIMALLALLIPNIAKSQGSTTPQRSLIIIFLGLFGAALLYGDGVITPAISVLSAIEGLQVATPAFQPLVVPLTIIILVALFSVQRRGTAHIGSIFGPLTLIWFITIAAIGLPWIFKRPEILGALSPHHAYLFFQSNGLHGFLVLSAVVLCITGGEALYADMGHFGRRPIQMGWFVLVGPCLMLNYLGQGALILEYGQAVLENPFYSLVGGWLLYPLVAIATLATVIASQALISGAYSLTQQAVQLGYLPRMAVMHTSRSEEGQIYVPRVNELLMISCILLVLTFRESTNLAAAYGIAVTGTMTITSALFYAVSRKQWNWPFYASFSIVAVFMAIDISFFLANLNKVHQGGWVPLVIGASIFTVMTTWKRGRQTVSKIMMKHSIPLGDFFKTVAERNPPRVKGMAVFMTLTRDIAPSVLLHHFHHNKVLHEKVILLSVVTENFPEVPSIERVRVTDLEQGFVKVIAKYGYMESPDIDEILIRCESAGLPIDYQNLSFYLGRETYLSTGESGLATWRKRLFTFLSRNARPATDYFGIPADKVIEIGSQLQI